jgi:uncharacterized protein (DUF1697 family)/TfoX/Sxy family transcriptional regulator of competence genes
VTERKMFGGVAFLRKGKMFCGIVGNDLMVRVGPERYESALADVHTRPMDFTGRPMNGYVFISPGGTRLATSVKKWVDAGDRFVATLDETAPTARKKSLTRYVLLLRGVNVGAKNSILRADLRAMLSRLGCSDVTTYVQSGNAVFGTKSSTTALARGIERALERHMGRPIATALRTAAEMNAIIKRNPFGDVATKPAYLCVTFLSKAPTKTEVAPLLAQVWTPERVEVSGKEIYTWHPVGQARSPLAAALAKLPVRGAVTTRNWNTVLKLRELLSEG